MKDGTHRPKTLSAAFVRTVNTPGRYGDGRGGHGLSIWVRHQSNGRIAKIWSQRLRIGGKPVNIGLGSYPVVTLAAARELGDGSGLIFPSPRGKALSDVTISKLVKEKGIPAVPHGFRSSFRDWAAECSDVPREIAEHALAHFEGSESEKAYRRTDYFERRRGLMQAWADYVAGV